MNRTVKYSRMEYVGRKGDAVTHLDTIEGAVSIYKRGMIGIYQHCGKAHLHRYLAEFDFRYNRRSALKVSDAKRHDDLLSRIGGKRLTYRRMVKPVTPKQKARRIMRKRKCQNR